MKKITASILFLFLTYSVTFSQTITTVAGGGLGNTDSAILVGLQPNGVKLDTAGNLYISTGINNSILRVDLSTNILTAIAGNGTPGYSGDGGTATSAQLNNAQGVAIDKSGNIYEADFWNNVIRKINPAGVISTFAGTGTGGYSGDGGPATAAEINQPIEVNVDNKGNVYIADYSNDRIRVVNTSGIITTFAGNGIKGKSGDGGLATAAELDLPDGVVVDTAGNVYISDEGCSNIRKVNTSGIITTIAGTGAGGFSGDGGPAISAKMFAPSSIFIDNHGNIYFGDQNNNRIRMIDTAGIITTIAGNGVPGLSGDGGPATAAALNAPQGMVKDTSGNIYIADCGNHRIRMVNKSGIISTVIGNGTLGYYGNGVAATTAELLFPHGVAFDALGNMYIADNDNYRIRTVNTSGIITTFAGNGIDGFNGDGGPATSAEMNYPAAIATDTHGNVFFVDEYNQRIREINSSGIISTVAGDSATGYSGDGGLATSAELLNPNGVAVDSAGNIYIADAGNNRIRMVNTSGIISTIAGDSAGGYKGDGGLATKAELGYPTGVTLDASGNIYIADELNNRVRKIDKTGIITTIAGNGTKGYSGDGGPATSAELDYPYNVACDNSGNIYIADNLNNVIRVVNPTGVIYTLAGNGTKGYSGDGGPAILAKLNGPTQIALDASGNIYIADNSNNRIRKVTPTPTGVNNGINLYSTNVDIYPIPSKGYITVALNNNGFKAINIFDVFGRKVYTQNLDTTQMLNNISIDLKDVADGLYFMQILTQNGIINRPFVVEK